MSNRTLKWAAACWLSLLAIASCVAVPWRHVARGDRLTVDAGRAFLLAPPAPPAGWRVEINLPLLVAQCVAATVAAPILAAGLLAAAGTAPTRREVSPRV